MRQEEIMQAECAKWFWNEPSLFEHRRMLHCNNNNSQNAVKGAFNKAMGVVKGVSDMELILAEGKVIFIELKTPTGTQSEEQKDFESKVNIRGHEYVVIRSVFEFKSFVMQKLFI